MTTVQKREGSRKLQPDRNSLQQQLLRNSASDRALLVVAADRAMARMKKGKRKAEKRRSTETRSEPQTSQTRAPVANQTPDLPACALRDDGIQDSESDTRSNAQPGSQSHSRPDSKSLPSVFAPAGLEKAATVDPGSGDCGKSKVVSKPSEQAQSKNVSEIAAETVSSRASKAEVSRQPESGQPVEPVTSAKLLQRATDLTLKPGDATRPVPAVGPPDSDAGPVALAQLLTRAVDETAPQRKPAQPELEPSSAAPDGAFNRQRTIDQQIHAQQLTLATESSPHRLEPSTGLTEDKAQIKQAVAKTQAVPAKYKAATVAKAVAKAARLKKTDDQSSEDQKSPTDSAVPDGVVSRGANDGGQIAAIQHNAIAAAAPYRALRRPRKRCGGLDHRYIQSSAVNSRRALAWDDLRFRYGLLPTVEQTQAAEVDANLADRNDATTKSGAPITRVRRPNITRRKAPAYVTELARLDADPALGSCLNNPFEIYQLELPLPERKPPLRERKLIESSKSSRPTQARLRAATELNRNLRIKNKWWLLSQTVLQRTSVAMIFLALMIAGVVLFQQPVVEKKQSMHEITTFKSPQPTGTQKTSNKSESNGGDFQKKSIQPVAPPASVPDAKSTPPRVDVDTIASEEIIDLVGQIEIAENMSRVPRLPRGPASGVIIFDPVARPGLAAGDSGGFEVNVDPNLSDGTSTMVAQVNPVIRSYLGPARAAHRVNNDISRRRVHSTVYKGLAIDRHPELYDFEIRLSQQSMEIFNTSILAADRIGGGAEIAYLGVADALGKNRLSFSMAPLPDQRIGIRPFSSKFDLTPIRFFKYDSRSSKPLRSIMVELDKTKFDAPDRPTAMASHPVRFDTIVANSSFTSMP